MSHFCALVITDNEPTNSELTSIMAPYHQYECTGTKDQYVIDQDITTEALSSYEECKEEYKDFKEFVEDWYGATEDGEYTRYELNESGEVTKVIKQTNPDYKWDWWVEGGRWTGYFSEPDYDPNEDPANQETCFLCGGTGFRDDPVGRAQRAIEATFSCNGCKGTGIQTAWPTSWKKVGTRIQIKDLNLDFRRQHKATKAGELWDQFHEIVAGRKIPNWQQLRDEHDIDIARDIYRNDPVMRDIRGSGIDAFVWCDVEDFNVPREQYVCKEADGVLVPFSFIRNGQWFERGEMGWFGMVHDEKDRNKWNEDYNRMIAELPDTTWLTVVDCHI